MKKEILLIIDPQNDFCSPSGSLYVPGAEKDMERLANFIHTKSDDLSKILISLDSHSVLNISHPYYWKDAKGAPPTPFTQIKVEDVEQGHFVPCFEKERSLEYLRKLELQGEFPHVIWPEHCIAGSVGAAIHPILMDEVKNWVRKGNSYELIYKGINPYTEHFGIVRANVPDPSDPATDVNQELLLQLENADCIWLGGEAESHCVANTILQLIPYPNIIGKIKILKDCMSPVTGFEKADSLFKSAGVQITNSISE